MHIMCFFQNVSIAVHTGDLSADYTALSADYIWPSGFLCGRPDGLELTTDGVS